MEERLGGIEEIMRNQLRRCVYYKSLNVNISAVHSRGSFSLSMDISLGEGMPEGKYELRSRLNRMSFNPDSWDIYLNESFALTPAAFHPVELRPKEANAHSLAQFDGVIKGPDGRLFAFGIVKSAGGEWYYDHRY